MELLNLFLIVVLISLTAFFVSSEFAIVKVRRTRIEQLVAEGNGRAVAAMKVLSNLDEYLSACQLGITLTSLGLGWLGEPTVEHLLHPLFVRMNVTESVAGVLSFAIAFSLITFFHVVIGELAPKTYAIQRSEKVTLMFSRPLILFYKLMYPIIHALNGSARYVSKLIGIKHEVDHETAHSEDELLLILSESYKSGEINQSEYKFVNNIFTFDDRIAKEIMVPRREIIAFDQHESMAVVLNTIKNEKYTRFPVMNGDKDHVIGLVNIKEILTDCHHDASTMDRQLTDYIRPIIQVIETIPIHDLLVKMQRERVHMAILVDEYGGTSGLVTVEDILEEIVGEIQDEFDVDEVPMVQKEGEKTFIVDGKVLLRDVNEMLQTTIEEDVDTIGGWILTNHFDIKEGDSITFENYTFQVLQMEGRQIQQVEITKKEEEK